MSWVFSTFIILAEFIKPCICFQKSPTEVLVGLHYMFGLIWGRTDLSVTVSLLAWGTKLL